MKKLISLLLILTIAGCDGQDKEKAKTEGFENEIEKDKTMVEPKEKWDVQKEYDEFGNLIKYDSIYTWSYSNVKGDSLRVNLDSIMDTFKEYISNNTTFKADNDFYYFPHNDSLFMNDFFKEDYFYRNWQNQHSEFEDMVKRMDSLRNTFLKRLHPGLMDSNKKN